MGVFILLILFAAWLQSMFKLILVPRPVRCGLLAAAVLPIFLFKEKLAACNLQTIDRFLADGNNLRDLCTILNRTFTEIMWGTGIVLFLVSALSCELFAWIRKTLSGRISAAMTASWILLLLAIFMPAAVEGKISSAADQDQTDWQRNFCILAILAGIVFFTGALIHLYRIYKGRKQKCVM